MRIMITGGNTYVPIDKVRGITNIFKGKTACEIAIEARSRNHNVVLLGNPEMKRRVLSDDPSFEFVPYRTYDELYDAMREKIVSQWPEVVIHSAAVSDYKVRSMYPTPEHDWLGAVCRTCGTILSPKTDRSLCIPQGIDRSGKVSSSHGRLTMELEPTEKIVDKIRNPWAFQGVLVKFKLQVDMSDEELLDIAKRSMATSDANVMVANCLEWARDRAYILAGETSRNVKRRSLASKLIETIEAINILRERQ